MKISSPGQIWLAAAVLLVASACGKATPPPPTPTPTETLVPTETLTPSATPLWHTGDTWVRPADEMVMVHVPAGKFTMGSPDGDADEMPVRNVALDAYWIDKTEVSVAMYILFAPNVKWSGPLDHPVTYVSWEDAAAYCAWVGARLPTEAEWEKAARGTDARLYPWGNQPPAGNLVNFADLSSLHLSWADISVDDGFAETAPVGSFPDGQSMYGAMDMAGNAAEWVNDWYDETYYSLAPGINPQGADSGNGRVLRGGSWYSNATSVRTTDRSWYIPEGASDYTGFRCASSSPSDSGAP
jgi:formylglycine-generating enzyme required for sulfatase activity